MKMLPLFFAMKQMRVLIIGGGMVALRKAQTLYNAEANITVIAPTILKEFGTMPAIRLLQRKVAETDLDEPYNLAIIATNDIELNQKLADMCRARRILVSRCDDFAQSDFICSEPLKMPPITLGVYCSGLPEMNRFIKAKLNNSIDNNLLALARLMSELRPLIKNKIVDQKERKDFLKRFINDAAIKKIAEIGIEAFKAEVVKCL